MRRRSKEDDEVEELLQAAQDDMILKLSVDSHTSRSSSSDYLDPDLHSRFLALKSQPKIHKDQHHPQNRRPSKSNHVEESPEDLMLRFSALKSSLPSSSPPSVSASVLPLDEIGEDSDEDAKVEKLIQWAIDAARLDPSPPSDDDQSQSSDNDDDLDDDKGSTKNTKP